MPPPRHNYVQYDQHHTLVHRLGEVESTLHEVNHTIGNLSASFHKLSPSDRPATANNSEWDQLGQKPKLWGG
jgi:hypothetical protein